MALFRKKFYDVSGDPSVIADTVNIRLQPINQSYPTGSIDMTIPASITASDTGWREANVTDPGKYDIYVDAGGGYSKSSDDGPIYIGGEKGLTKVWCWKGVTITGSYDSVQSLTVGSGDLSQANVSYGGTLPGLVTLESIRVNVVTSYDGHKIERVVHFGNLSVSSNTITFDVWTEDMGRDFGTIKADIYLYMEE